MKRALLLLSLLCLLLFASAQTPQLPKTNRAMAAVDMSDPENPKVEIYLLKADGDNFRVPIADLKKYLESGYKMRMLETYNAELDRSFTYCRALEKQHAALVDDYNVLAARFNRLSALSNAQPVQQRDWMRDWILIQGMTTQPMTTQPETQPYFIPTKSPVNCTSTRNGNTVNTECR